MKTEVKVEVKEETIEGLDAQEQIGIDLITNKDFNYATPVVDKLLHMKNGGTQWFSFK